MKYYSHSDENNTWQGNHTQKTVHTVAGDTFYMYI